MLGQGTCCQLKWAAWNLVTSMLATHIARARQYCYSWRRRQHNTVCTGWRRGPCGVCSATLAILAHPGLRKGQDQASEAPVIAVVTLVGGMPAKVVSAEYCTTRSSEVACVDRWQSKESE